jgi:hypothetical protein
MKVIGGMIRWVAIEGSDLIMKGLCDFLWLGREARPMPAARRNRALAIGAAVR